MELAPFNVFETILGCQGVIGPFPSAFLDKWITKNWRKVVAGNIICQIFFREWTRISFKWFFDDKKSHHCWRPSSCLLLIIIFNSFPLFFWLSWAITLNCNPYYFHNSNICSRCRCVWWCARRYYMPGHHFAYFLTRHLQHLNYGRFFLHIPPCKV